MASCASRTGPGRSQEWCVVGAENQALGTACAAFPGTVAGIGWEAEGTGF